MRSAAVCLLALAHACTAFYLPGVAPRQFELHERVEVEVNKLTSTKTQLPYEYYSLPFCKPDSVSSDGENLGEVLAGDKLSSSLYQLRMGENRYCNILCRKVYTQEEAQQFADKVADGYRVDWVIDNLPAATKMVSEEDLSEAIYVRGFQLGQRFPSMDGTSMAHYLNNHVRFVVKTHQEPEQYRGYRIVGFEVEAYSVKHHIEGAWNGPQATVLQTCNDANHVEYASEKQSIDGGGEVIFTYDVKWEPSDIKWSSRWTMYLRGTPDDQAHWFSIVNSLMIVLFLTGMVAMIMLRTLRRDIARYNDGDEEEEREETGWKLVHGDVFRPPSYPMLLSVLVGSGAQILGMTFTVLSFALLGFLSPANRGGLLTSVLLLFVFMGAVAGYASARLFKSLDPSKHWRRNTLLTAVLFPGVTFVIVFILNLFVWSQGSSSAIPFGTFFALLLLWFGISSPLVFLGAYYGYKQGGLPAPVRVNQIPREVPEQPWFLHPAVSCLVSGMLPFGAVFIELYFIMSALWLHHTYYVFGFLFLVLIILVATCAEIAIVMCYFQLCNEDYSWWWRSFLTSGSSAAYLYAYSILYYNTKLEIEKAIPSMIYFGYMAIIAFTFFLLTGTIGFVATFFFNRIIYASIKVD